MLNVVNGLAEGQEQPVPDHHEIPAVEISSLNKWFGPFHALRDVGLTVKTGGRIVICGPSGSGKSTLLMVMAGLERLDGGEQGDGLVSPAADA